MWMGNSYQVKLMRSLVCLANQDLDNKHGADHQAQSQRAQKNERKLQKLSGQFLPLRKVMLGAAGLVDDNFVVLERRSVYLDVIHAANIPADTEVRFLQLPVLEEHGAPDASEDGVGQRVFREEEPGQHAGDGWECQEDKVHLDKGEVEGDLQIVSQA